MAPGRPSTAEPLFTGLPRTSDTNTTGLPTVVGFDCAADRTVVPVVAATHHRHTVHVELVGWWPPHTAVAQLTELRRRHRARLAADRYGPTAPLVDELTRKGITVSATSTGGLAAATAAFTDALAAGTVTHPGDPVLADAITQARRRRVGQLWVPDRGTPGDAATIAAVVAHDLARIPAASVLVAAG